MAMLGICAKFLGCISISVGSGVKIISTLRSTLFPVFRGKGRFSLGGSLNPSKCNAILVVTITIEWANPTPHIVFKEPHHWLVVEPTHLKNMLVKMGSSSPIFGVNIKKYLSCHHLGLGKLSTFEIVRFTLSAVTHCIEVSTPVRRIRKMERVPGVIRGTTFLMQPETGRPHRKDKE